MDDYKRLPILKNDISLLKLSLRVYEDGKSNFESREQIERLIEVKEAEVKKIKLNLKRDK